MKDAENHIMDEFDEKPGFFFPTAKGG